MRCGPHRTPAYISDTQEYSSDQHHIRLFISKKWQVNLFFHLI